MTVTRLESRFFDELDACVELAELVMASAGVREDLHAIESHIDVRT